MKIVDLVLGWYAKNIVSRWTVFMIDLMLTGLAFGFSFLIMVDFKVSMEMLTFRGFEKGLVVHMLYGLSFLIFRSFSGIIRHTGVADASKILKATSTAGLVLLVFHLLTLRWREGANSTFNLSFGFIFIHYLVTTFLMICSRFFLKGVFNQFLGKEKEIRKVLIYGAGASGRITKQVLERDTHTRYRILGFLDDNPSVHHKSIDGIPIFPSDNFQQIGGGRNKIDELIVSIQNIAPRRKKSIVEYCLSQNIMVKVVPPLEHWMNGELSMRQIAPVAIEDLLQRDPINLANADVSLLVREKVVMVTGAAGSIGSELVKQLMHYDPAQVICVDQAETPLHNLQLSMANLTVVGQRVSTAYFVADVSDSKRMRQVMRRYRPQVVFHAAAYKHVPLMEENPSEAVRVNVLGTTNLLHLALEWKVQKFVMISTDKAVNPTNVMGATKRMAEMVAQSMVEAPGYEHRMEVVTTRFGNVLGSNGSVIPLFRKQMEAGGPLTVTHPEITRYFMTIPEACQLVLEAATMGKGGEIYVFDMGDPIRIADLAHQMIQLSGLIPNKDIHIKYTGLRPGEKLYEELLATEENSVATHHPKIMIAKVRPSSYDDTSAAVAELREAMLVGDDYRLVAKLKQYIPEYLSNNSRFGHLDKENPFLNTPALNNP